MRREVQRRRHSSTNKEISMAKAAAVGVDKGGRFALLEASELGDL
ncbi:hypothetical protein C7458_103557 [Williamsia muralis]|nr:hypothetical protein C7458_103557 [Williamsia marianensis]